MTQTDNHQETTAGTAILVCGMHRGGTSAVSRVVSLLGAQLPTNLMTPSPSINPRGFWESVDVADANDRFLAAIGFRWDDPRTQSGEVLEAGAALELETTASRLIERDFPDGGVVTLKDPRFARSLPIWRRVLERLGFDVRVVLVTRHPLEVSASLARRDGFSKEKCLRLWLRSLLDCEYWSRDCQRHWVDYGQLLSDWEGSLNLHSVWPDLTWSRSLEESRKDIDEFLSEDLHHHRRTLPDLDDVHLWIREAYNLAVAPRDTGDPGREAAFDRLRNLFDEAEQLFGPDSGWPSPVIGADPGEVKPFLRRELGALTDRMAASIDQVLETTGSAVDLGHLATGRIEWLEGELAKTREDLSALREAIEARRNREENLTRDLRLKTREVETASFERVRLYAELEGKASALEAARLALKEAQDHQRNWLNDLLAATSFEEESR